MAKKGEVRNLSGMRFGRLLVSDVYEIRNRMSYWLCKCDCGNEKFVSNANLSSNNTTSCGCYRKERSKATVTTHNSSRTRIYIIASGILSRCNNVNNDAYHNYGGRGIECKLGNSTFEVYESLLKVEGYFDGAQIDRIDNDGHYELGNIRWVTPRENSLNRRNTIDVKDSFNSIRGNAKKIAKSRGLSMDDLIEEFNGDYYISPKGSRKRVFTYIVKHK